MRRVLFIIFTLAVLVIAGLKIHAVVTNTSDNAAASFANSLARGNTDKAYGYLTGGLLYEREAYWQKYLSEFKQDDKPTFIVHEYVVDPFNTYGEGEMPERFVYAFQKNGKTYNMTIIMVRHDKQWKIDELFGADTN